MDSFLPKKDELSTKPGQLQERRPCDRLPGTNGCYLLGAGGLRKWQHRHPYALGARRPGRGRRPAMAEQAQASEGAQDAPGGRISAEGQQMAVAAQGRRGPQPGQDCPPGGHHPHLGHPGPGAPPPNLGHPGAHSVHAGDNRPARGFGARLETDRSA